MQYFFISKRLLDNYSLRTSVLFVFISLFIISITYSIYKTSVNQPWAYFDSFARVWEFSLGGILAVTISKIKLKQSLSIIIGWVGLLAVILTGILLPVSTMFPGYVALIPTLGAMFIILSSRSAGKFGVHRLLSTKPLVSLGGVSYGIYLFHWPLLVFYLLITGRSDVTFIHGLSIIILSIILSYLVTYFVEKPIRKIQLSNNRLKLSTIVLLFLVPFLSMNAIWNVQVNKELNAPLVLDYDYIDVFNFDEEMAENLKLEDLVPNPLQSKEDIPISYHDNCHQGKGESEVIKCYYGNIENPDYIIALVGGSHSGHWFTALEVIAEDMNIKLDTYIRDGCRFSADDFNGRLTEKCMEWNIEVKELLLEAKPDIIFTTATVFGSADIPNEYKEIWMEFDGISEILAVRDNPRMPEDVPSCLEIKEIPECSFPVDDVLTSVDAFEDTEDIPANVTLADLSEFFCDDDRCTPVIGNILVYRDEHHLTASYVKTLSKPLQTYVEKVIRKIENRTD